MPSQVTAVSDTRPPLSVERIREVLAALPISPDSDAGLMSDYHRIVEIHQLAQAGGVRTARAQLRAQVFEEVPESEGDALPEGTGLAARRLDGVREEMRASAQATLGRLATISADEEQAVLDCAPEIESALAQLR
jgi:hypothetical protein